MKKPAHPQDEKARHQSLVRLNIQDTGPEERFDRITRLTQQMFATKVAAISFIDANRQWVKSCVGEFENEIPRDISFCGHTILSPDPMLVKDTVLDSRFFDNPMVVGPPCIRFYAGCPIKSVDGVILGTLSILDNEPRGFDQDDLNSLRDIADLVERELAAMELTTQDPLTGLLNEQGFRVISEKSLFMCERLEVPASLVCFDVRNLREINRLCGNREGDNALIFFAELLMFGFRDSDVVARLEGDKFAVLMTNTPIANTQDILDRFKARIERYGNEKSLPYTLDFNVGVSWVEPDGEYDYHQLLSVARALATRSKVQ